ncbi:hypothetical protein G6O69_29425 [Pseudenhygromyxa sp. WMMC2535]|uniref:hypothetical protein n=1 Tax=Pseudenhygromyxa sp. WMMC2535 TaxID=2712867 RepID=UPI001553AA4E|nr:hypothetical protein [Pseudenhygromyxa sp. WMMC2535]NVB41984.1 hypothetical protein [Pseudenhygromyxa sp. WMMC2535]
MARALLEPVAAGQTRFRMQGLSPDARGIAVGREALVVFESIDRLVSFLGAYSEEGSLDDLLPSTTLERGRRGSVGSALLLRCEASDGYALDRLARLAGATRSQLYVGAGSVFARYRESRAPFGYDLAVPLTELLAEAGQGADPQRGTGLTAEEVAVVDVDFVSVFRSVDRIDPVDLIQRLELRSVALPLEGIAVDPELCGLRDMALVLVAPGVADRVLGYLWRKNVAMAGIRVTLSEDRQASLLLRLRSPQGRLLDVLRPIPGVELLAPVSPRAAVEIGYAHPIHLASASSCLPGDEMYLFRGRAGRVERIDGAPRFVDGRFLVHTEVHLREAEFEVEAVELRDPGRLEVQLQLRPSSRPREPRATLVAWKDVELLRKLIYLIPPSALAAARLVPLSAGLLVLAGAARRAEGSSLAVGTLVPLGARLVEVAPGVLVPDGYELWPRLRPKLIRELLELGGEDRAVFLTPEDDPIHIPAARMTPLDAAAVGTLDSSEAELVEPAQPALEPGVIENQRLGRFALWGFRSGEEPDPPARS